MSPLGGGACWDDIGFSIWVGVDMGASGVSVGASMILRMAVEGTWVILFAFTDHKIATKIKNRPPAKMTAPRMTLIFKFFLSILNMYDLNRH
jgi:hypothetical protein